MITARRSLCALLVLASFALAACALSGAPGRPDARGSMCPVTPLVRATEPTPAPQSPLRRDPIPTQWWYRSPDQALWAPASHLGGGGAGRTKVVWIKPVGARLEVTGRRLDGPAAPLGVEFPEGYPGDFQASALIFPTGGCWEVEARIVGAGPTSVLRIVAQVQPAASAAGPR